MSTAGSLAVGPYIEDAVRMAREHRDFVVGFIAQRKMESDVDFLVLTPGVGLDVQGDSMGQQYRTPRQVILESHCDVIIVGRGIYGKKPFVADNIASQAKKYRDQGWSAYLERIGSS